MDFTDPRTIIGADWAPLQALVYLLWGLVICNVAFAGLMLLGHIVIPSMYATGHIRRSALGWRWPLTVVALLFLAGSVFMVVNFLGYLPAIYEIYPHKLI